MDTFSHALWGWGVFGQRGRPWLALLFGALPDLSSFGVLMVIRFINGTLMRGRPEIAAIPWWTLWTYDLTHSLLVAGGIVLLVNLRWRRLGWAMLAWPLHICLDFPFHSRAFFPTKLFWPISTWSFDGIPWGNPWVWFPNVAGLVVLFSWRLWRRRRRRRPEIT